MPYTLDRDPDDKGHWLVLDPLNHPDTRLTAAVERMRETGIAETTWRPYARSGLRFFDWYWERTVSSATPFTPWDPEEQVRSLIDSAIVGLKGTITTTLSEPDVRHIAGADRVLEAVADLVSGTGYLYEGLIRNRHYLFPNPIMLPESKRKPAFLPMLSGGRSARRVLTKFYYRVAGIERPGPRVDDPSLVEQMIDALEDFRNMPRAVILLVKIAMWGLGRLSEQISLTIWDWWKASRFKNLIATKNKGQGEEPVKEQLIPDELADELTAWGNNGRVALDRHGRSLDEWAAFLSDETRPLDERKRQAIETPLIPNRRKGFYSASGIRDVWFVPAMKKAGLVTRFHFIRHAGVCDAYATIDAMEISEDEKTKLKIAFGRHLGWAWPERMVEWYATAEIKTAEIEIATEWQRSRRAHLRLIASGEAPPRRTPAVREHKHDGPLKTLFGLRRGIRPAPGQMLEAA